MVIDPTSKAYQRWDLMTFATLCFTAVVTPAEVAFVNTPSVNVLFFVNRFVDAIFIVDLFLNFFVAYLDDERGNILIKNRMLISQKYLKSWFVVDLLSAIPFDVVSDQSGVAMLSTFKPLRCRRNPSPAIRSLLPPSSCLSTARSRRN